MNTLLETIVRHDCQSEINCTLWFSRMYTSGDNCPPWFSRMRNHGDQSEIDCTPMVCQNEKSIIVMVVKVKSTVHSWKQLYANGFQNVFQNVHSWRQLSQ